MSGLSLALDVVPTVERTRFDRGTQRLIGGECLECGAQMWPRRAVCYRCGNARVEETPLPRCGRLVTWTEVWVPVEGLEPPYVVGLVELGALQIFGHVRHLDDAAQEPLDVDVRIDPDQQPPYWFEPRR